MVAKSLILCEGKNDKEFLSNLIVSLGYNNNTIDIESLGNKSNFFKLENYTTIKPKIDYGQYELVLFVLDADTVENDATYGGYENTENEIKSIITQLSIDSKVKYYIMCDPVTKKGYLESFLLATLDDEKRDCINHFISCSDFISKENHKAIIHQIYKLGYPDAPFDFSNSYFDTLKEELNRLNSNSGEL